MPSQLLDARASVGAKSLSSIPGHDMSATASAQDSPDAMSVIFLSRWKTYLGSGPATGVGLLARGLRCASRPVVK